MRKNSQTRQIQGVKSSSFTSTQWMKAWTCPRLVGLTVFPPQRFLQGMFSSTLHHYPPHLDTPIDVSSPVRPGVDSPPAPGPVHIPHPPEPHVNDYLRRIVEVQERQYAVTRRLSHSLALHNRRQLRYYVALERYQHSLRRQLEATLYLGDQIAGIHMSLQRLVTRLGENIFL
ncbi:hypothetical protein AB205_0208500 [Aquarana catesbeiana]|uniref:Uncharacterized protein n=1 Tax=Aquarana catesbeiana TaxID=8400 RepID=A0A2G9RTQ2_AQUCT|nr:hypothetical protein AB205_0208500 [Aquarana catesbeiana]PIO30553.1 hypothetical protein AB205_0208500 [Aquarana catesbeiana]